MVLLVAQPAVRVPERSYAISVLLEDFLGIPYRSVIHDHADVRITLAEDNDRELWLPDVFLSAADAQWLAPASLPKLPLRRREGDANSGYGNGQEPIPVLFGRECPSHSLPAGTSTYLDVDVFGSAFFLLTRYEEAIPNGSRDSHGRFPVGESIAKREDFLRRPLVNEYLELLWGVLHRLWPELTRKERRYRPLLTHDVDELTLREHSWSHVFSSLGADLLLRREPGLALRRSRAYLHCRLQRPDFAEDPYNTFDFVMNTADKHGLRSSFYFVLPAERGKYDPSYDMRQAWAKNVLRAIHERGHEVGLHGSYDSYDNRAVLAQEWQTLQDVCSSVGIRQDVWGGRQHYLRWTNPYTWQSWNDIGLSYDSTLTYAQEVGFRCSCCYEYPVFNLNTREKLRLRERPLVAMDSSLLHYMGCSMEEAEQRLLELVNTCRRYQGEFMLLWHTNWLVASRFRSAFERVVAAAV